MSDPTSGGRHRANADRRLGKTPMSEDDSLAVEAYGPRGAALRKTLATGANAMAATPDSTVGQKVKSRVKKLFGG